MKHSTEEYSELLEGRLPTSSLEFELCDRLIELQEQVKNCSTPDVRHCAFQYWDGRKMVEDKSELTLDEAKKLWNDHYADMVEKTEESEGIEVAIWINMKDESDYRETLIHLNAPEVRNGKLYEPKYYDVF